MNAFFDFIVAQFSLLHSLCQISCVFRCVRHILFYSILNRVLVFFLFQCVVVRLSVFNDVDVLIAAVFCWTKTTLYVCDQWNHFMHMLVKHCFVCQSRGLYSLMWHLGIKDNRFGWIVWWLFLKRWLFLTLKCVFVVLKEISKWDLRKRLSRMGLSKRNFRRKT